MNREQEHEADLGELDQRLIGPAQKIFKSRFAVDGETKRQEMQRQEDRERQAGKPMHHRGDPQCAAAMFYLPRDHGSTTAATPRMPSSASSKPNMMAQAPAPRSESGDHSVSTLRTPIEAWIETARTNSP